MAWGALAVAATLTTATLGLMVAAPAGTIGSLFTGYRPIDAGITVALLAYAAVGALIMARRPDHRVGWIFLGAGVGFQLWVFAWHYGSAGLLVWPGALPGATTAAWLSLWILVAGFGPAFTFLPQVFPTGTLLSRRWRPLAWFSATALLAWAFTWATAPGPMTGFADLDNPAGLTAVGRLDGGEGWVLFVVAALASAASLVVRYARSSAVTRQQIRWLVSAVALMGLALVLTSVGSEGVRAAEIAAGVLFPVAVAGVPVAAFVAIFRHDLYDLDLVVSKTIAVGMLLTVITLAYVAAVAAIGAAVGTAGELSLTLAVVVTALVAVAFQPIRTHVGRVANRLVYGHQAAPYEVLAGLARRLARSVDAEDAPAQMAKIVAEALGATVVEVWLVVDDHLRRVAAWTPQPLRASVGRPAAGSPRLGHLDQTVQVRHRGELLGAIGLALSPGRTLNPTEERLVRDLAVQAGLVLSNVRLLEQLKASRQRLIAAQDEERRRIERDLHDGVQQRLVTLALTLRMEAERIEADPAEQLRETLDDAAEEAMETLAELRQLARGIHPAIITEGGLTAALESVVQRAPLPVELRVRDVTALPPTVEVTVYYLVAEALTNVSKHAAASSAIVTLEQHNSYTCVEVADDGVGGAAPAPGSGLAGLTDRIAALGGHLAIDSPARSGTRLRAEIPCGS